MEPLPDLSTLSDPQLKELIERLRLEEDEVSYRRRILHGKIDILRAELVARLQRKDAGELGQIDIDRLSEILAAKSSPPAEG